jgi:hypothetical protein
MESGFAGETHAVRPRQSRRGRRRRRLFFIRGDSISGREPGARFVSSIHRRESYQDGVELLIGEWKDENWAGNHRGQ